MRIDEIAVAALTLSLVATGGAGCGRSGSEDGLGKTGEEATMTPQGTGESDPHSYARPEEAVVTNVSLDLDVDFERKAISGSVRHAFERRDESASEIVFDTRDLRIEGVTLAPSGAEARFSLGEPHADETIGRPLVVEIEDSTEAVVIDYETSPGAAALQWLAPAQTAGGEDPFLFTQGQAILTRTWIPCQDSPAVRATYDATVRVPGGLMAVMSAENATEMSEDGVYAFRMPQAIPSYLIALAVGDLEFRSLGPRSGAFAEPSVVDAAAYEFADTEKMIDANVALYGPYRWGRYDILVLPPSFPFGGMENPRLTFATPTILAGDRSLNALIAHELAHSWSGNLVTNASWDDLWLNEGFTVYVENRVMEVLYGRDYSEMLAQLGRQDLEDDIARLTGEGMAGDTKLKLDLVGRNPDDAFSQVPYDKGYLFLRLMEQTFGREKWDAFLRGYFEQFAFQAMNTERFLDYLKTHLVAGDEGIGAELDIEAWVYGVGLPENAPRPESPAFDLVDAQLGAWSSGTPAERLDTEGWNTHQWLHFLRALSGRLDAERMAGLDAAFDFTSSGNSEIKAAWLEHVIRNEFEPGYGELESFLKGIGRRKFLRPLYAALAETEAGLARAREIYAVARPSYHSVSSGTIDALLGWDEESSR